MNYLKVLGFEPHFKLLNIHNRIDDGLDCDELKAIRKELYKIKNSNLTLQEEVLKITLLQCIKEFIE